MTLQYFISDLHLDPARPRVTEAFAAFLRHNTACDSLYILGDLFETWVGDDDDSPLAGQVRALLMAFSAAGPAVYLMPGNRDFLLGNTFCTEVGAQLLPDSTVINLHGKPTLLMHGDSLCIEDTAYQAFRLKVRSPEWRADVLGRNLEERRSLATELRAMSGEQQSNKADDIMDATPSEVARVMTEHGVTQMIHGHTHRPKRHTEPSGSRWVLGDWHEHGWALAANEKGLKLNKFIIS